MPHRGHGNPLQYSCLENLMDRRAWWATVHGVAQSQTWLRWQHTHGENGQRSLIAEVREISEIKQQLTNANTWSSFLRGEGTEGAEGRVRYRWSQEREGSRRLEEMGGTDVRSQLLKDASKEENGDEGVGLLRWTNVTDRWDSWCRQLFLQTTRLHVTRYKSWSAERIGDQKQEGIFSIFSVSLWGIHQMQLTIQLVVPLMSCAVYLFILDFKITAPLILLVHVLCL